MDSNFQSRERSTFGRRRHLLGRRRPNCLSTLLELKLGPLEIPELLQRIRAQRKAEARPVRGMHHAVRAYVEGLVEELPHHWHVALCNLKDMAVGGCHRNVNTRRKQYPTAPR